MPVTLRAARPTNSLEPLRRFYVDGLGLPVIATFEGHQGFDGLVLGAGDWELEFVVEAGVHAPRAPTHEHLVALTFTEAELGDRLARLEALGARRVAAHNPYWNANGVTFEDPDGYHVVLTTT